MPGSGESRGWRDTRFTERLGISYPIVQGPFGGGFSTPELAAAVSNAGGLGSFGASQLRPEEILEVAGRIRELTSSPFALNLWVSTHDEEALSWPDEELLRGLDLLEPYRRELGLERPELPRGTISSFHEQVQAILEARPAAFSFVFGIPPESVLGECRRRDIVTVGAATTLAEAEALEAAGVDMIVASGFEAGGHRPSFLAPAEDSLLGTLTLLTQVVDRIDLPVIAAGGIADARGVAGSLAAGAAAAQLGTAFLACVESGASSLHREKLFSEDARTTVLTRAFTGRLARSIENRLATDLKHRQGELAPYPIQSWLTATLRGAAIEQGRADLVSLWAGQGAPVLHHRTAADLMHALVADTDAIFARLSPGPAGSDGVTPRE